MLGAVRALLPFALVLALGCSRAPTTSPGVDAAITTEPARASATTSAAPPAAPSAPPALAGPIAIKGYPHAIRNGMNDPAQYVGWSKDGATFGYCATGGGRDPQVTTCELVDGAGKVTRMTSESNNAFDPKKKKQIDEWLKANAIPEIPLTADPASSKPAPLAGTWAFTDITLDVDRPAAPEGKPVVVRVGGSVSGEPAVYPVTLASASANKLAPPHFAAMNGMAVSPDGKDLGMVATFFACEYCDSFAVKRLPLASLASSIYNDTGFRHHQKGDFAKSSALFEKAATADPTAKLPAYNLACALAQLGDARTERALAAAIQKDPSAKARAKTDKDFAKVKDEPWFAALVR